MTELVLETSLPDLYYQGKVRDTYRLDGFLLMVATDRISAFDVVLPGGIPEKGVILSRLSAFWFRETAHIVPNHFLGMADELEGFRGSPLFPRLSSLPKEIARRAMVVRKAERVLVEAVVRGYITGSAWAEYTEKGTVGEYPLPKGLKESQRLPHPLFTPTTKAATGHDLPLTREGLQDLVGKETAGKLEELSLALYNYALSYALERGIIIADTKFEFGYIQGKLALIDELLTPDSSRFWDKKTYRPGQPQESLDKQLVRNWLTQSGWNREPPAPSLPPHIVEETQNRYLEVYQRLTGASL